jgi:flagellar biosynthesis protein FliR
VDLSIAGTAVAGYVLALARTAGFVLTAPPFNTRAVPGRARAGFALALAIPLSVWTAKAAPSLDTGALAVPMLMQIVVGAALGFLVTLAVTVVQTVGDIVDVAGGFSISIGNDPLLLVQSSVMGRLHQLLAVTLLFAGNGHLLVLQGLSRSMQVMPVPALDWSVYARVLTEAVSGLFMAAVQITAPVLAALLLADVALGLLTRAAPAMNAFALAFPLKILLSLLLIGLILVQIPGALANFINQAAVTMLRLSGG